MHLHEVHFMRVVFVSLIIPSNHVKPEQDLEQIFFWEGILGYWDYVLLRNTHTHAMHFVCEFHVSTFHVSALHEVHFMPCEMFSPGFHSRGREAVG